MKVGGYEWQIHRGCALAFNRIATLRKILADEEMKHSPGLKEAAEEHLKDTQAMIRDAYALILKARHRDEFEDALKDVIGSILARSEAGAS